jgi:hypothetical protein
MSKNVGPISLKTQTNSYPQYKPKENEFSNSNNNNLNVPQFNTSPINLTSNNNSLNNIKSGYYPSQKFVGVSQLQSNQITPNTTLGNPVGNSIANLNMNMNINININNINTSKTPINTNMNSINNSVPNINTQWQNNLSPGLF